MKKKSAALQALQDENTVHSSKCSAYGCPMWGSVAHETRPPYHMWCPVHFFCAPERTQAVTAELNKHLGLIDEIRKARHGLRDDRALLNQLFKLCDV